MPTSVGADLVATGLAVLAEGRIVHANDRFGHDVGHDPVALEGQTLAGVFAPDERKVVTTLLDQGDVGDEWTELAGLRADALPFVVAVKIGGRSGGTGTQTMATLPSGAVLVGPDTETIPEYVRRGDWERVGLDRVLSHDVRGSLRGAGSFLTLLEREIQGQMTESAAEFYTTAKASTARADHMVDQIVHYLRLTIRPLRVARLPLGDIVDEAVAESLAAYEGDPPVVELGELPTIWANPPLLTQALGELITNARKFSDGPVTLHLGLDADEEGWAFLHLHDDGLGIDPDFADDAFSMFRLLQPKGRYPGVGMGLAMVRRIIEVHGGRCWIEPADPPGTTVRIRLALAP